MILGYRHMNVISSLLLLTALVLIFVYGYTTPIPLILLVVCLACSIHLILHRKEWEEEIRPDTQTALGISLLLLFIPATLFLAYQSRKSDSNV
jgi:hypothetical protein